MAISWGGTLRGFAVPLAMPLARPLARPISSPVAGGGGGGPVVPSFDPDAAAYIAAVELADGASLELGVKQAYDAFVVGCKADGTWAAIKASCILAGARTLAGALVPLRGLAPTNTGPFVSGDYSRTTGLLGNGSTKYLDTNRSASADPQDNHSLGVFISTTGTGVLVGAGGGVAGASLIIFAAAASFPFRVRIGNFVSGQGTRSTVGATGLLGASRSNGSEIISRYATDETITNPSTTAISGNHFIFARNTSGTPDQQCTARLAFYWTGEAVNLALLDTRVTTLLSAIGAALA